MFQAENAFGGLTPTLDRFISLVFVVTRILLHIRFWFLIYRLFGFHIHRVIAFTGGEKGRFAFAKNLDRFRLQAFVERRVAAFENPELDLRDFRQGGQLLQMPHRRLSHGYLLDLRETTKKFSPDHLRPTTSNQLEVPERSFGVLAIVGLEDLREENVGFLAPSAHEFLKVRKALEYGMNSGWSDELANTGTLEAGFESGAEQGDEGETRWRDLQRV